MGTKSSLPPSQVVAHVLSKSKDMRIVTCQHYSKEVERGLTIVLNGLKEESEREEQTVHASIAEYSAHLDQLRKLQKSGKSVK